MDAVEVSTDVISTVADVIHAEVTAWQQRALEPMYPAVCFGARRITIGDEAPCAVKRLSGGGGESVRNSVCEA